MIGDTTLRSTVEQLKCLQALLRRSLQILEPAANKRALKAQALYVRNPATLSELETEVRRLAAEPFGARAIEDLNASIEEAWRQYKHDLEEALQMAHIPFTGAWPQYFLHSLIKLIVDLGQNKVKLNNKQLRSADIPKVIEIAKKLIVELINRPFDAEQWISALQCIHENNGTSGAGHFVNIRLVRKAMREKYGKKYTDQHLAIDLVRLMDASRAQEFAFTVEVSPARNPTSSLYLPGPSGGFISGLRITPRTQ